MPALSMFVYFCVNTSTFFHSSIDASPLCSLPSFKTSTLLYFSTGISPFAITCSLLFVESSIVCFVYLKRVIPLRTANSPNILPPTSGSQLARITANLTEPFQGACKALAIPEGAAIPKNEIHSCESLHQPLAATPMPLRSVCCNP